MPKLGYVEEIAALRKAIRDANSWIQSGEGVPLTYYSSKEDQDSIDLIERVLKTK